MDEVTIIWSNLRNALWPAFVGLMVGVGIVLWHGPGPVWLIAGMALVLATIAGLLTARARPSLVAAARATSEAGRAGLPPLGARCSNISPIRSCCLTEAAACCSPTAPCVPWWV